MTGQEAQACRAWPRNVELSTQDAHDVWAYLLARSDDETLSPDRQARAGELAGIIQEAKQAASAASSAPSVAQLARAFWEAERALEAERDRLLNITIDERILRPETTSRATYMRLLEQRRLAQDALFAALEAQHADPA